MVQSKKRTKVKILPKEWPSRMKSHSNQWWIAYLRKASNSTKSKSSHTVTLWRMWMSTLAKLQTKLWSTHTGCPKQPSFFLMRAHAPWLCSFARPAIRNLKYKPCLPLDSLQPAVINVIWSVAMSKCHKSKSLYQQSYRRMPSLLNRLMPCLPVNLSNKLVKKSLWQRQSLSRLI